MYFLIVHSKNKINGLNVIKTNIFNYATHIEENVKSCFTCKPVNG